MQIRLITNPNLFPSPPRWRRQWPARPVSSPRGLSKAISAAADVARSAGYPTGDPDALAIDRADDAVDHAVSVGAPG